jgi:hypothetical protein
LANATAQIFGANFLHISPAFGQPQVVIAGSAGYNSAVAENQGEEFQEKGCLGDVLVKVSPNC